VTWSNPIDSDKHYWHRYSGFYQRQFASLGHVSCILEYGVFKGASIAWSRRMFPEAEIFGVDILPPHPDWPSGPGITYLTADQGDRAGIARMLRDLNRVFDLVIEDGSHIPQHQATCLAETFPLVRPGGLYVLEDLQTSHARHPVYRENCVPGTPNALHLLLAIERSRALGQSIRTDDIDRLSANGPLTTGDIRRLDGLTSDIEIFHRATLPLRCYACGGDAFDPVALVCACGTDLDVMGLDSVTAVARRAMPSAEAPRPGLVRRLFGQWFPPVGRWRVPVASANRMKTVAGEFA